MDETKRISKVVVVVGGFIEQGEFKQQSWPRGPFNRVPWVDSVDS